MSLTFENLAYVKLLLHVHKHPTNDVNGILLGRAGVGGDKSTSVVDVVPLFHTVMLAPMFEVAMLQIDVYCKIKSVFMPFFKTTHCRSLSCFVLLAIRFERRHRLVAAADSFLVVHLATVRWILSATITPMHSKTTPSCRRRRAPTSPNCSPRPVASRWPSSLCVKRAGLCVLFVRAKYKRAFYCQTSMTQVDNGALARLPTSFALTVRIETAASSNTHSARKKK